METTWAKHAQPRLFYGWRFAVYSLAKMLEFQSLFRGVLRTAHSTTP